MEKLPEILGYIKIPYGNYGERTETVPFFDEYKTHRLGFVDKEYRIISKKTGLVLQKNSLNAHLPNISIETWKKWVDWVNDLDPDLDNTEDVKTALSGDAPSGKINNFF